MVAPIKGPFVKNIIEYGPANRYGYRPTWKSLRREWRTQAKPRNLPLPFDLECRTVKWSSNTFDYSVEDYSIRPPPNLESLVAQVYRKAYAKFLDTVNSSSAELLTLFCERKEAANMIADRSWKLALGVVHAKNGDVRALKRTWGKGAGIRRNLRATGGHVLEYSFGWAPLVSDIASAVQTLNEGSKASGKAGASHDYVRVDKHDLGSIVETTVRQTRVGIRMGWEISVEHPSLALLSQLGLLNPVSTAWERVPYSFVVDYFLNVNDVISSMTALAGCTLHRPYRTTYAHTVLTLSARWDIPNPPSWSPNSYGGEHVKVSRITGIPSPTLGLRPPWNLSWSRAATSVALLLQQLGR